MFQSTPSRSILVCAILIDIQAKDLNSGFLLLFFGLVGVELTRLGAGLVPLIRLYWFVD